MRPISSAWLGSGLGLGSGSGSGLGSGSGSGLGLGSGSVVRVRVRVRAPSAAPRPRRRTCRGTRSRAPGDAWGDAWGDAREMRGRCVGDAWGDAWGGACSMLHHGHTGLQGGHTQPRRRAAAWTQGCSLDTRGCRLGAWAAEGRGSSRAFFCPTMRAM
eukprot:scaffold71445_cov33-Phaeocystis_antarctica.AAC.2